MRAHRIASVVQSIAESTEDYSIVVIAATGECADAAKELPVTLLEDSGGTWPQRINAGYRITNEPYIFTGADDLAFRPGWFQAAMRVMETIDGVVAVNDLMNMAGVHYLISKNFIETIGGVIDQPPGVIACESYTHQYVDDEIRATAIFRNRWGGVVRDSIVEHLHPGLGKSESDLTYQIGEASGSQGYQVFQSRAHLWASS
jgi:hypothetical protein